MRPLYVELSDEDRERLERLAANSGALAGRPVHLVDVIRQLLRDASRRKTPVRVQL